MAVEEVILAVLGLEKYVKSSHELLPPASRRVDGHLEEHNAVPVTVAKKQLQEKWHDKLKEDMIHGQFSAETIASHLL